MPEFKAYNDMIAKYLLGREETKDILLDFINTVFEDAGYNKITSVEIQNPFNLQEFKTDKLSVLDIKAKDENGRFINIEIQVKEWEDFPIRSLYYWSKNYSGQLKTAEAYSTLKPTICINVLNYELEETTENPHNCYMIMNKENPELVLTDHLIFHYLELPKIKNFPEKTKLIKWLEYFQKEGSEEEDMTIVIKDDPILQKAHSEYKRFTADEKMQSAYLDREKAEHDRVSLLEQAINRGKREERAKFEKEREKYEKEKANFKHERAETVRKMLMKSMSLEDISDITGLSKEEIEKLM